MENPEMDALVEEMLRRQAQDGIPRYITKDNVIMKCDWELSEEASADLDGELLEEYIRKLLEEKHGTQ